jgi:phosphoribosylformimino-5-aminoimidazole carboxamide ribotide isomerase
MVVLPVLDILNGHVVHGVAGRRSEYRRIVSRLTTSNHPLDVAKAIRAEYGLDSLYVADLDGILAQKPNLLLYRQLIDEGFDLLVDAGLRISTDVAIIRESGVDQVIVGLESCRSPDDLAAITATRVETTFSLDLFDRKPCRRCDSSGWSDDSCEIIRQAIEAQVNAILPLDLSDVGMGTGGSNDSLCRFTRNAFPSIRLITGGGVRNVQDLRRLRSLGVDAVLVATALHEGTLTRDEILALG